MLATRFGSTRTSIRSGAPLEDHVMQRIAPSIFATQAHDSRSARYTYIPTIDVLNGLRREGFMPFEVTQSRSRVPGKAEFTKHMIRMRRTDQIGRDGTPEIILINSHDGTSSYQMLAGYFEFVCTNGLITGKREHDVRVPHKGNITDNVIDAAYTVVDTFRETEASRETMLATPISRMEQLAFARAALELKYEEAAPIEPDRLLTVYRREQATPNVWNTFNQVQEHLIRGGQAGRTSNNRRTTTRAVTGIDQNVKINRALWVLAEEMKKIKMAA